MNGPDPLSAARQQLSEAISKSKPATCDPLRVSPWIAMSVLQKSIRRGEERLALRAAATLLRISPERLWRRCGWRSRAKIFAGEVGHMKAASVCGFGTEMPALDFH
jgi:hypothetical protein